MVTIAAKRAKREIMEVIKDEKQDGSIKIKFDGVCWTDLEGVIGGPPDTPYEGGTFNVNIKIPETYPFKPPEVRFLTKIWHPNVSSMSGNICLDILEHEWVPVLTLRTVLLSIQALLSTAEPNDPLDAVVAKQFIYYPNIFKMTACYWTNVYAGGPVGNVEYNEKITTLKKMGADEHFATVILSSYNWDIKRATERIFGKP